MFLMLKEISTGGILAWCAADLDSLVVEIGF